MQAQPKRILLKISGEALSAEKGVAYDKSILLQVANQIKTAREQGAQIAIVVGGGNFWRGRQNLAINRSASDYMGMLATIMNAVCLRETLTSIGVPALVQTSITVTPIAEPFDPIKADQALTEGKVVIFGGGTGCPYFSTDTTASLRAAEINADALFFAKNVDGIYDKDPKVYADAKKYDSLSYDDFIAQNLKAMDSTAVIMCKENNTPVYVFALLEENSIVNAINGNSKGGSWIK